VRHHIELGLHSVWKYFEHAWDVYRGPTLVQMQADKKRWAEDIESAVNLSIVKAEVGGVPHAYHRR